MSNSDEPLSGRQMPSSFDENHEFYNEKPLRKVFRKLREEPLVPLGAGLTVFALLSATKALRRGDSITANRMFRARVAAQGFTVLAMVGGGMYYQKDRDATAELRKLKEARDAEEKRQKWIRELEARDEEEKAMKAAIHDRRAKAQAAKSPAPDAAAAESQKSGGGVLGAIGLSGWGKSSESSPSPEESKKKNEQDAEIAAVRQKIKPPVKPKTQASAHAGTTEDKPEESSK